MSLLPILWFHTRINLSKLIPFFSAILFSLWFTSQICFIKYSGIFPFILKTSNLSICLNFDSINSILKKGPKCANQSNRLDEWVTHFSVNLVYRIRIIARNYWNDSELRKNIMLRKMKSLTAGFKRIRKKSQKIGKIKIQEKHLLKIFINPKPGFEIRFWNLSFGFLRNKVGNHPIIPRPGLSRPKIGL